MNDLIINHRVNHVWSAIRVVTRIFDGDPRADPHHPHHRWWRAVVVRVLLRCERFLNIRDIVHTLAAFSANPRERRALYRLSLSPGRYWNLALMRFLQPESIPLLRRLLVENFFRH